MNAIFLSLGIESWKPFVTALLLPPLPLLLLIVFGARLMFSRRLLAWLLVMLGVTGLWLCATPAAGSLLTEIVLRPPPALGSAEIAALKRAPKTAIVVLGGGRQILAPEYGISTLRWRSVERLRYGVWLARETGLPLAYSGGIGYNAEKEGPTEAEVAARVAEREFGRPLRWQEDASRDTRENAFKTVALLQPQGIEQIVVVTHDYHMRRALANFARATEGKGIRIVAAPMGLPMSYHLRGIDWLPSMDGFTDTWVALHECLGNFVGS